ncbi:MAG: hypothetical protein DCC67_01300 [Planctomycetota bacterium]|nr:MAG: hypothetical protein DCC67_01300 [Planctomycetota bacterium]
MGAILKIYERHGRPMMNEYKDEKYNPAVDKLTYPNGKGRSFYIEGDLILTGTITLDELQRCYPDVWNAMNGEPAAMDPLLELALLFVGVEQAQYPTAWVIQKIIPTQPGDGALWMQKVLLMDQSPPIPLGHPVRWSLYGRTGFDDLGFIWRMRTMASDLKPFTEAAQFIAETGASFGTASIGKAIFKKIKRKLVRALVRRGLVRLLRLLAKALVGVVPEATQAAVLAFIKEAAKEVRAIRAEDRLRAFTGQAEPVNRAIAKGATAAAAALVASLVDATRETVFKRIDGFVAPALGMGQEIIKAKVKGYLYKRVIALFTTDTFGALTELLKRATLASLAKNGEFDEAKFARELSSGLLDQCKTMFKRFVLEMPEAIVDDLVQLVYA